MEGIEIYKSLSRPPKEALRTIIGGKLKGMSDINPQWRYEAMTERFGLVGIGWKYEISQLWTEDGANGEKLAFAKVAVYVKQGGEWSDAIVGIGGSRLISQEKGALTSNDEGYKMAVTDAFSTALKMLGVAADIYAGRWDGSKYSTTSEDNKNFERIKILLATTDSSGKPVFSDAEKMQFRALSKTVSSAELVKKVEISLQVKKDAIELQAKKEGSDK